MLRSTASLLLRTRITPTTLRFARWQSGNPPTSEEEKAREWARTLQRDWDAKIISYEELKPKTESPDLNTFLVDVREPDEVIQGMIPSAVNIPLSVLANSLHLPPEDFKKAHGFDKPKTNQQLIFYCRSGKRSTSASDVAKRNGYTNILNYQGSWLDWIQNQKERR